MKAIILRVLLVISVIGLFIYLFADDDGSLGGATTAGQAKDEVNDGANKGNSSNAPLISENDHPSRIENSSTQANTPLTNAAGNLTSAAIEQLGLDDQQIELVQTAFNNYNLEVAKALVANVKLDEAKSNPDKRVYVYNVRALSDRGKGFADNLYTSLEKIVGSNQASVVVKSLSNPLGGVEKLGGYGKYDVTVKFHPSLAEGDSQQVASYTYYDPDTGGRILQADTNLDSFENIFGELFELDGVEN